VKGRPPQLSPHRLLAGLVLPLVAYTIIRAVIGSATGALAITTAVPAVWLVVVAIARRRLDPVAVIVLVTTVVALAAFVLTGGDALALKLRRGAVTGPMGIAVLASVALGRSALLLVAEHVAKLNPDHRAEIEARLADPQRRRVVTILTAIVGTFFTLDGASQVVLALTVPTGSFVADATAARIIVLSTGLIVTATYLRYQKQRRHRVSTNPG
jgi:hypothetical protein